MSCLAAKPVVNGIQDALEGSARVIRLDIQSEDGKSAARRFGVSSVPTTLLLDRSGHVVLRESGTPDRDAVVESARAL